MGLVSGLSLTNHSDSESFLVVHSLLSQDGCQRGFWEVVGHVVSPFDLSWTLLVGTSPCSLLGPPVVKQLVQVVTMVPGQGEQFQSGCSPNSPFKGIPPFLCPHKPFAFVISKLFWKMIFSTYTYWDIKMVNPAIFFFSSLSKENVGEIALFTDLALFTFGETFHRHYHLAWIVPVFVQLSL